MWENDKKEGFFVIDYVGGEKFQGTFSGDRRNGEGTHYYTDGSRFHGDYKNDYRHGHGLFWTPKEYYYLQKLWMRRYEEGTLLKDEEVYTDTQREAEPPNLGFGTHINANGERYEGDFVNGKRHGKGCVTFPNGDRQVGEWAEGTQIGNSMRKTCSGEVFFQVYKLGELVTELPSDELNWLNFFWYDEGGFASHN